MPTPFFMRWLAISLAVMLCVSCGTSRDASSDAKTWTVDVTMSVQLDEGFVAQQAGILNRIQFIHDDLEWQYNKGVTITKNVAGAIVAIAVVAGVVVLMSASNTSPNGGGSPHESVAAPLHLVFADKTCTTIYHEQSLKPGIKTIAFKAPPGEEVYLFSTMNDIRYALNKLDTPKTGGPLRSCLETVKLGVC